MKYDLIIIGGGAAGLMSAAVAAEGGAKVLLLEKMEKVGRKIRITGKGRCNVTNNKSHSDFLLKVRAGADFIKPAFEGFDNMATIAFFERIGVAMSVEQGGRVYPKSGDAWDVAVGLEKFCLSKGVEICCKAQVTDILKSKDGKSCSGVRATIDSKSVEIESRAVVIATGGVSYPATGSTGDGYNMAYDMGHTIEPLRPSLVPFDINGRVGERLQGLILKNIGIALVVNSEEVANELGEIEFFRFGVGGGSIFRLSRVAVDALMDGEKVEFVVDLKPALSIDKLKGRIAREIEAKPAISVAEMLQKLLPAKMCAVIGEQFRFSSNKRCTEMSENDILIFISALKKSHLEVVNHRGFKEAIVTAGGVVTDEIDSSTMESKIVKGLFFAGEIMDIDADTGGYNLQLAFSTAHCVAKTILRDESNR